MPNCGTSAPISYSIQYFYNPECSDCATECGSNTMSSKCVFYAGAALTCSGIETNDDLETALQKIDEQICSAIGDYSTYQFNCLTTWLGTDITTEAEFVDAITAYTCEIATNLSDFTTSTFTDYQEAVEDDFLAITSPGITCASASITNVDTLSTVYTKYCNKFVAIDEFIDISDVIWDDCFTVSSSPLNIGEAFSLIADQICQLSENSGAVLPTFNNSTNCLDGGVSDTLVTTIGYITDRLCSTQVFSTDDVTWGCLDEGASTLQQAFQTIVDKASLLTQNFVTFDSGDFTVTQTDEDDVCQGITVALNTPIDIDRFVAVNDDDDSPGTLVDKLVEGTGITLTVVGETLEISSTATTDSFQVKADASDAAAGYLNTKIAGDDETGITLTPTYNAGTDQLDLLLSIDKSVLFDALLDQLLSDSVLYTKFCERVAGCPSPCAPPTNVQAVVNSTSSTTTTL